jgi:hypothetical protein
VRIVETCRYNQWPVDSFRKHVESDLRVEVRLAAAYDAPVDMVAMRAAVIDDILYCALPAGNA